MAVGTGIKGNGLRFNGTESYFRIPNVINSAENYTISMWVKFDSSSQTNGTSINLVQQTNEQKEGRSVLFCKSKMLGSFVAGSDITSSTTVPYGAWQYVIITNAKGATAGSTFKVYQNGIEVISSAIASGLINKITDLQFGCHKNTNTGYSFKGDLDEVRIYNKTADAALVAALAGENAGVLAYAQLQTLIQEATTLSGQNAFAETEPVLVALKAQIVEAQKLTSDSTATAIEAGKTALTEAIDSYRAALLKRPIEVTIDTENVVRTIPEYMFGANHRYHLDGCGTWDVANT